VRTLVTGGAGFIGSHLVDALVAAGHTVTVVDDLSRGRREQVNPAAELIELDITSAGLAPAVAAAAPEVVFHEAAQIDVRDSVRDPLHDAEVNVLGTVSLLRACADAKVARVILASSGGALYGDTDVIPTPEEHPCRPASPYGTSKLCAEMYAATFQRTLGLDAVSLRYANVYGPRQDPHGEAGVVAIFATRLLAAQPAVINGDGLQTRDYVFVADVVRANLCAIDAPAGAYNVGTGRELNVNDLFDRLCVACATAATAEHGDAKPGEQQRSCLSTERAASVLGWSPAVALDEGLARTVAFFRGD
jgi:UDP-glucose 4-epimerase